jgi:DNA-binding MarR family transcriptional regulator
MRNIRKREASPAAPRRPLEASIGYALGNAFRRLNRHVAGAVRPLGITASHVNILLTLWDHGTLAVGELQERLGFSSSALTGALDRMEEAGLVKRVPSPSDRRSFLVEPAPWSRARRVEVIDALVAAEDEYLAGLTPAERGQLLALLGKLVAERGRRPR